MERTRSRESETCVKSISRRGLREIRRAPTPPPPPTRPAPPPAPVPVPPRGRVMFLRGGEKVRTPRICHAELERFNPDRRTGPGGVRRRRAEGLMEKQAAGGATPYLRPADGRTDGRDVEEEEEEHRRASSLPSRLPGSGHASVRAVSNERWLESANVLMCEVRAESFTGSLLRFSKQEAVSMMERLTYYVCSRERRGRTFRDFPVSVRMSSGR
ncbi:hypothetical protein SKAU_G00429430 [Synaphobranchus kaupii]|uniref:Uncharacterized protein n=1 Tax=Synaphobranchus kaupii TaxID=118154 RepID=A0A9Q1I871_SYNKA|nr:hypothetical protein SKAU_G00429430 [Synaphobranchus kaupii]